MSPAQVRAPMVHDLKCEGTAWLDVRAGCKSAEFRRDDRGFAVRDVLILHELDPAGRPSGRVCWASVRHVCRLDGFGAPGFVLLSLGEVSNGKPTAKQLDFEWEEIPF